MTDSMLAKHRFPPRLRALAVNFDPAFPDGLGGSIFLT
jgi:hypothetical protein